MIYKSPQNPNAHLTAKERKWTSYPTKQLWQRGLIRGRVLDFGCGLGADVTFLQKNNMDITGYDPCYAPTYPTGKYDTILCNYVLNVLFPEEQAHVLMAISELLKPTGSAYFTVRRDVAHSGFRVHAKHRCRVYQCKVALPYPSILKASHCEIYKYTPYNQRHEHTDAECAFCGPSPAHELVTESATAYSILPDSSQFAQAELPRQVLIIPKRHTGNYFELSWHEKAACWLMVDRVYALLQKNVNSDSSPPNVQIVNADGQNVFHTHIQLRVQP